LLAAGRSAGQDWHFEANARDRAGAWLSATKKLLSSGEALLECNDESEIEALQNEWQEAFGALKVVTGQSS
jgi:hypothetical protein